MTLTNPPAPGNEDATAILDTPQGSTRVLSPEQVRIAGKMGLNVNCDREHLVLVSSRPT